MLDKTASAEEPRTRDDAVERAVNGTKKVTLKPLKQYAAKLPRSSPLRELILTEPADELDIREFLGRVHVWLKLLRRCEFLGFEGRDNISASSRVGPREVVHGD
jgi:hypothetical protein